MPDEAEWERWRGAHETTAVDLARRIHTLERAAAAPTLNLSREEFDRWITVYEQRHDELVDALQALAITQRDYLPAVTFETFRVRREEDSVAYRRAVAAAVVTAVIALAAAVIPFLR